VRAVFSSAGAFVFVLEFHSMLLVPGRDGRSKSFSAGRRELLWLRGERIG
jgi:hypothetical protein